MFSAGNSRYTNDAYGFLRLGVILNSCAADPACELDDGILLVREQPENFWPHVHVLHIGGIVY